MRTRGSVACSGIVGAADAGEDLAALREVPVAEARAGDHRVGDPGAAAQDAIVAAEEDLRVLRIRKGTKTGVTGEVRARPLPDRALQELELTRPRSCSLLPFRLARQPLPGPTSIGVGLPPGNVRHRLTRREWFALVKPPPSPVSPVAQPEQWRLGTLALPPRPAFGAPDRLLLVAACVHEAHVLAVRYRRTVDLERGQRELVSGMLVIVGPRLRPLRAERERTCLDQHLPLERHLRRPP